MRRKAHNAPQVDSRTQAGVLSRLFFCAARKKGGKGEFERRALANVPGARLPRRGVPAGTMRRKAHNAPQVDSPTQARPCPGCFFAPRAKKVGMADSKGALRSRTPLRRRARSQEKKTACFP